MQLRIRARHVEVPAATRAAIERKVRLALGRQAPGIERAEVTLSPSLQESAGSRCRILLRLREGESLVVEDHAEDPQSAAAVAAWRLEHRLDRKRVSESPPDPRRLGTR